METKYGFTKFSLSEFEEWITDKKIIRTVLKIQQHHTFSPSYKEFDGKNHFERQRSMKNYHVNSNGWNDIGQHFSIFPDGTILTGRSLEQSPACIYGQNANAICIENVGNFDKGGDTMIPEQAASIIRVTALLCKKFNLPIDTNAIVYHHWFHLSTGVRNNGSGGNKSCPGTNFFGGNKVADCEKNFLPLVKKELGNELNSISSIIKYVSVQADSLNIRIAPEASSAISSIQKNAQLGAILRVYEVKNGWYKISQSASMWVNGKYTKDLIKGTVSSDRLNVRSGPGTNYKIVDSLKKGDIIFLEKSEKNWSKLPLEEKYINHSYIKINN